MKRGGTSRIREIARSPPVRGRGLKRQIHDIFIVQVGRPPCGGVD